MLNYLIISVTVANAVPTVLYPQMWLKRLAVDGRNTPWSLYYSPQFVLALSVLSVPPILMVWSFLVSRQYAPMSSIINLPMLLIFWFPGYSRLQYHLLALRKLAPAYAVFRGTLLRKQYSSGTLAFDISLSGRLLSDLLGHCG